MDSRFQLRLHKAPAHRKGNYIWELLSFGLSRRPTGTKFDIVAELVTQLGLPALGTQAVVGNPLWSAIGCPGALLAQWHLVNSGIGASATPVTSRIRGRT